MYVCKERSIISLLTGEDGGRVSEGKMVEELERGRRCLRTRVVAGDEGRRGSCATQLSFVGNVLVEEL